VTVTIRQATRADGARLYALWEGLRRYNASIDERIIPALVSQEDFIASFEQSRGRAWSAAFVAEAGGDLVGFITGGIESNPSDRLPERHGTIGYLYVADEFRRQGVARGLFDALAEWAAAREGVAHFEMTVLAADSDASQFWRSIGFSPFIERLWAPLPPVR
jgi:GNAT superfamily N-acetyltransferase